MHKNSILVSSFCCLDSEMKNILDSKSNAFNCSFFEMKLHLEEAERAASSNIKDFNLKDSGVHFHQRGYKLLAWAPLKGM